MTSTEYLDSLLRIQQGLLEVMQYVNAELEVITKDKEEEGV